VWTDGRPRDNDVMLQVESLRINRFLPDDLPRLDVCYRTN
jgi:hypothetical protein